MFIIFIYILYIFIIFIYNYGFRFQLTMFQNKFGNKGEYVSYIRLGRMLRVGMWNAMMDTSSDSNNIKN